MENEEVWIITGLIGCVDRSCKTARGGVQVVNETPKEKVIRSRQQGSINIFEDIDHYMAVRARIVVSRYNKERFLLAVTGHACRFDDFFRVIVVQRD